MLEYNTEHQCPDCGETCFCNGGATDVFDCTHQCEWEPEEDDDEKGPADVDDYLQYLAERGEL